MGGIPHPSEISGISFFSASFGFFNSKIHCNFGSNVYIYTLFVQEKAKNVSLLSSNGLNLVIPYVDCSSSLYISVPKVFLFKIVFDELINIT